jgi:hypothetical protein
MGALRFTGGHLCIDLNGIEMSGDEQRGLLHAVESAVVGYLALLSTSYKVVTVSMSQNNGADPIKPTPEPPKPPPKP